MGRAPLALAPSVATLVAALAAGCGGDAATGPVAARIDLSAASATLAVGGTLQLVATPRDSAGATVAAAIAWSSDAPAVASVAGGLVTGLAPGSATVTARAGSASASAAITVAAHTAALSLTRAGGGGGRVTSQPAGIDCDFPEGTAAVPCSAVFAAVTSVTLTAAPHPGSRAGGFGAPCAADPCTLTVDHDQAVEVRFTQGVHLAVSVTGDGRVTSAPAGIDCGGAATACAADWPKGTVVVLTAAPGFSTLAATWGGACSTAAGSTCSLSLDADASVPVAFAPAPIPLHVTVAGGGRVVSAPAGIDCSTGVCTARFAPGTLVALQALPAAGNVLGSWSGACTGSGGCALDLNKESSVTASFVPGNSTVGVTVTGSGRVTSTPAGIDCPGACSAVFPTLTALQLQPAPAAGFGLRAWGGACGGGGACALTLSGDSAITADFTALKTLAVTVSGRGSVSSVPAGIACPGTCSAQLANGAAVQLLATPADAFSALGTWSGACTGSDLCSFTLAGDTAAGAAFVEVVPLTVSVSAGSGSVSSAPAGILCPPACTASYVSGTQVTLAPHGGSGGWMLSGWSGDCAGAGAGACSVTMTAQRAVGAAFAHQLAAQSIDLASAAPFATVVVTGAGFDPATSAIAVLLVPRTGGGVAVTVPAVAATGTAVGFSLPPLTSTSGAAISGATDLQIVQLSPPDLMTSASIPGPVVSPLPAPPAGAVRGRLTSNFLQVQANVIASLAALPPTGAAMSDVQSRLTALGATLAQHKSQIDAVVAGAASANLATTDGKAFVVDAAFLARSDALIGALLQAVVPQIAAGSTNLPLRSAAAWPAGCPGGPGSPDGYDNGGAFDQVLCQEQRQTVELPAAGRAGVKLGAEVYLSAVLGLFGGFAATAIAEAGVVAAETAKGLELIWTAISPTLTAYALQGEKAIQSDGLRDAAAKVIDDELKMGVPILGGMFQAADIYVKASGIVGGHADTAPSQGVLVRDPTVHPGACDHAVLAVYQAAGNLAAATMAVACGQSTTPATAATLPGGLGALDGGAPDAGAPDAGSPDAGHPDGGAPDGGTSDGGTDGGSGICCCWFDATHYGSNGSYCPCWNCQQGTSGAPAGSFCQPQCVASPVDQCTACP